MNYANPFINFAVYPNQREFFGLSYDELRLISDQICQCILVEGSKKNLTRKQLMVWSPFNCAMIANEDQLIIGISNDKALVKNTILWFSTDETKKDSDSLISSINETTENSLGYTKNVFTSIPVSFFKNPYLKKALDAAKNGMKFFDAVELILNKYKSKAQDLKQEILPSDIEAAEKIVDLIEIINQVSVTFISNIIKEEHKMNFNPIFKARNLVVDDRLIFVALPFTNERLEIMDEVIKPALEKDKHMSVLRSGDMFGANLYIMENIWTYINKARVVIVDISDKNPNVFYELGICNTIGKSVITICDEESYQKDYSSKLPFDIIGNNVIFYRNHGNGMRELVETLEKTIDSVLTGKTIINSTIDSK